ARGLRLDPRVGSTFLHPGIGWGGSCLPKDLASLIHLSCEYGYHPGLLGAVGGVNLAQRMSGVCKLQGRLKLLKRKSIAHWGLAFKPGTDDVRDAPALTIAERLAQLGASIRAYDPQAMEAARRRGIPARLCTDLYEAAQDADAVALVTEWPEFTQI